MGGVQTITSRLMRAADGALATPAYSFGTEPNTGMFRVGREHNGLFCGGTQRGQFDTTGMTVTGILNATGT